MNKTFMKNTYINNFKIFCRNAFHIFWKKGKKEHSLNFLIAPTFDTKSQFSKERSQKV